MSEMFYYDLRDSSGLTHSLATQVARELGRKIVAGFYTTGDIIEDENALAARYHVSRSVIRDAIKILTGKGLLEVRRGIGTHVRNRANWSLFDDDVLAWHQSAPPNRKFLENLMDFRFMIEPKAAAYAAERGSKQDHQNIKMAFALMEREKGSLKDFIIADAAFHKSILNAANNELLSCVEGIIFSALLISIRITNSDPRDNKNSLPSHKNVVDAIIARNSKQAEKQMVLLLTNAKQKLEEFDKK
ncbi:MAG: FadR family transcriptional regulator [Alphaproteobacteria bacterium]|nr:FadR family transcriptional regulator [Alphaproteobacteria bacterium]